MTRQVALSVDQEHARRTAALQWVVSPAMQVEQLDATAATIYLESTGARIRIARTLYDLLLRFEQPRSVLAVAGSEDPALAAVRAIANLQAKGFLVAEDAARLSLSARPTRDPPVRLFDCPAQKFAPAQLDVVVVGVPYDLSDRWAAGARKGPASIRQASLQLLYGIDRRTGRPKGWFDMDRGRPILQGVSIGDGGDVFVDCGESQVQLLERIRMVLNEVTREGALPVLLGGDASISFPAIEILQRRAPLAVIRIGCYADRAPALQQSSFVTPAALPVLSARLPGVRQYVHLGACATLDAETGASPPRVACVSIPELQRSGLPALERYLERGQQVYLGLDMNAVATGRAPSSGNTAQRLTYAEMHALLYGIGATYSIVGLDLVGLNPSSSDGHVASMTALHVLLTVLSAAKDEP